jgi:hypothetical protein
MNSFHPNSLNNYLRTYYEYDRDQESYGVVGLQVEGLLLSVLLLMNLLI